MIKLVGLGLVCLYVWWAFVNWPSSRGFSSFADGGAYLLLILFGFVLYYLPLWLYKGWQWIEAAL